MTPPIHERISLVAEQLQAMLEELRRGNRAAPVLSAELDTLQQALVVLERLATRSRTKRRIPLKAHPVPSTRELDAEGSRT